MNRSVCAFVFTLACSLPQASAARDAPPQTRFDPAARAIEIKPSFAELLPRIGLAIHTPKAQGLAETERQVALARELGFSFIRTDLFWARVEATPGHYDFSSFDPIERAARAHGLGVLWTLGYGNSAYGTPGYGNTNAGDDDSPAFAAAIPHYAAYASAAAAHFAGTGARFEVWNEPDRNAALNSGTLYESMFAATLKAMRAVDPSVRLCSGGVSNFKAPLLSSIVDARETTGSNAVGVHPYRSHRIPETLEADTSRLRTAIDHSLGKATRIWDTEWGYSAVGDFPATFGDGRSTAARDRQAVYDVRELLAIWQAGLPVGVLYELIDGGTNAADREDNFGLLDAAGSPKPAYDAIAVLHEETAQRRYVGRYTIGAKIGLHAMKLRDVSGRGYAAILWLDGAGSSADVSIANDVEFHARDVFGHPIATDSQRTIHLSEAAGPVYLHFADAHASPESLP